MKSIFFPVLIVSALSISLISCEKDGVLTQTPPHRLSLPHPFKVNLVADTWVKYSWTTPCDPQNVHHGECPNTGHANNHTMYVSSLPDALSAANLNCHCTIKVYLVTNNNDIKINDSPIMFMGNELEASVMQSDINITYKSNASALPFSSLNISVVGE